MTKRATHDAFFKRILSDPKKARAFLRRFLPPKIVARLADRLPVLLSPQHVNGNLRVTESDLVYRVFLEDDDFFDAGIEHKSAPQREVHVQLYGYYHGIKGRDLQATARALRGSPTVITLLAYHGPAEWNPVVTLDGETAQQAAAKHAELDLEDFRDFRAIFVDFKRHAIDDLTEDRALQAALYAMARQSLDALDPILARMRRPGQHDPDVLTYIVQNWHNVDNNRLQARLEEFNHSREDKPMGTLWDEMEAKSLDKGRAEGRAEGRAKGKAEALLNQLLLKFEQVSAGVREQVGAASGEQLDAWLAAVLSADSLDEVFAGKG